MSIDQDPQLGPRPTERTDDLPVLRGMSAMFGEILLGRRDEQSGVDPAATQNEAQQSAEQGLRDEAV